MFYAVMLYGLIASVWPGLSPARVGVTTFFASTAIETFKLVHTPALDAFRLTLAGRLLLGRFFSFNDLLAYVVTIAAMVLLDCLISST